jgi:hypothetical protein
MARSRSALQREHAAFQTFLAEPFEMFFLHFLILTFHDHFEAGADRLRFSGGIGRPEQLGYFLLIEAG